MIDWLRKPTSDPTIQIGETSLPVIITRRRNARRLTMRLGEEGREVRVSAPDWCSTDAAMTFVESRRSWLKNQLDKVIKHQPPADGDTIRLRNQEIILRWQENAPRKPRLTDNELIVGGPEDNLAQRIGRWLQQQTIPLLKKDAAFYAKRADLSVPEVGLSRARRRWGSCSSSGTIRINWRLVQAPDDVRRSVVAHEIAHLVHFDHSPQFHAFLDHIFEADVKSADRWLKAHGPSLYLQFG
ncbi:MAG: M48 family metallopeptidase [Sphingomonadaceae bacterium]